ncbi:hypothetical protein [Alteribacter natronophilus]|uniref:hypothetical protein n=1 Tax=Alteribacter natronophilus TaxID=2583810 RepID=UPI001AEE255D|nr:hypothetical protein [Alteribacter natronophilus]
MSWLSPNFFIGSIRIGAIEGASCMNMGNNYPANFRSHKKHNQGFGSISGDNNSLDGLRSVLSDPDVIDVLTQGSADGELPEVVQKLLAAYTDNDSDAEKPHSTGPEGTQGYGPQMTNGNGCDY